MVYIMILLIEFSVGMLLSINEITLYLSLVWEPFGVPEIFSTIPVLSPAASPCSILKAQVQI